MIGYLIENPGIVGTIGLVIALALQIPYMRY